MCPQNLEGVGVCLHMRGVWTAVTTGKPDSGQQTRREEAVLQPVGRLFPFAAVMGKEADGGRRHAKLIAEI